MTREPAEVGSAANSYEILAKLAMGGMAEIFLARGASAAGVERYVVLKRVLRHRASDVHFVQMFLDEARLAAQLQHPNIAQVYDIGKLGDSYFFTMEYVHGETVRNLLARSHGLRRQIPISAVLSIMAGAAAGLHHAHQRKGFDGRHLGIVHRDVSPSNLMISYEGTVKVVDFGVAKAAHRSTETQSGTVKGKISYMSPEQCKGAAEIDRRSDLFSLGIVMWEVLTTEKLFRRSSDFETMQAIVSEEVPPPSRLRPEVPPEIDRVVGRLLAKDPAQRFQDAEELHEAIESVAVRVGSALSAASLGRYIRELFGQRPEPWIELATQDQHPEAFTVTSEPIPNNLALTAAEDFDRKLSAVPALTERLPTVQDPARPLHPTIPLRVDVELVTTLPINTDPQDLMRTLPIRDSAPRVRNVVELPVDHRPPSQRLQPDGSSSSGPSSSNPMPPGHGAVLPPPPVATNAPIPHAAFTPGSGVGRMHAPSVTPTSSPHYPIATGASIPAFTPPASYPVASRADVERSSAKPPRSRALLLFAPAAVLGIVLGIVLALSGDKPKPVVVSRDDTRPASETTLMVATPEPPAAATTPAPTTPEPTVPAPSVPASSVPAPSVAAPTPAPPVVAPTPAPPVVAPTPAPTVPAPSPAAAPKQRPTVTSTEPAPAPEPMPDDGIAMPDDTVTKLDKVKADKPAKTKPEPKPDPQALFKAADYAGAVAACSSASQVSPLNAAVCTMSACRAKQAAKAKRWFKSVVEAKKASVLKECDGVLAADKPPPVDPCKSDPMACQH